MINCAFGDIRTLVASRGDVPCFNAYRLSALTAQWVGKHKAKAVVTSSQHLFLHYQIQNLAIIVPKTFSRSCIFVSAKRQMMLLARDDTVQVDFSIARRNRPVHISE